MASRGRCQSSRSLLQRWNREVQWAEAYACGGDPSAYKLFRAVCELWVYCRISEHPATHDADNAVHLCCNCFGGYCRVVHQTQPTWERIRRREGSRSTGSLDLRYCCVLMEDHWTLLSNLEWEHEVYLVYVSIYVSSLWVSVVALRYLCTPWLCCCFQWLHCCLWCLAHEIELWRWLLRHSQMHAVPILSSCYGIVKCMQLSNVSVASLPIVHIIHQVE